MRKLAGVASLLLLAACALPRPKTWVAADGPDQALGLAFTVQGPQGWMRRVVDRTDVRSLRLILTRDGTALQRIVGDTTAVGMPLALGTSKRVVEAGMSPLELGELALDDLRSASGITELTVLETTPARLADADGFHVLVRFRDGGLPRRLSMFGVLIGQRLYWLFYAAPERVYFERDVAAFGQVVRSFKIVPGWQPPPTRNPQALSQDAPQS